MTGALGDRADVHAATLRRAGAGVATPIVRAARQHPSARSRSGAVHVLRVHPWVWQVALLLARGDARLIHIESERCVIIGNAPRRTLAT